MPILVLYAKIKLPNGELATGPVTTQDYKEFHFKNTGSSLDLYFHLEKNDSGWHFTGGPSIRIPQSLIDQVGQLIDQVGNQIDQELVMR